MLIHHSAMNPAFPSQANRAATTYSRSILAAIIGGLTLVSGHEEHGGGSESASVANTCTTTATVSITTDVLPSVTALSSSLPPTVSVPVSAPKSSVTNSVVPSVIASAPIVSSPGLLTTGSSLSLTTEGSATVQAGTETVGLPPADFIQPHPSSSKPQPN
ncbi:MAG: hypothetical protein Q9223_002209 [Gallowayella weberi]